MSNYIFNDSFGGEKSQVLSGVAQQKKKQLPAIIFICTALIASSLIILTLILAFNAISNKLDEKNTPRVTNNTSYVSDSTSEPSTKYEANSEDPFSAMKNVVVTVSTRTGSSGSGVIAGEFSDSNGKHGYYIVTCSSIINNNRSGLPAVISDITLENGEKYEALLCGSDNATGIAVLKIYESEHILSVARWASKDSTQPSGLIIFGSVGGGVFNLNGELVGINNDGEDDKINFISGPVAFEAYERLTALQYEKKIL